MKRLDSAYSPKVLHRLCVKSDFDRFGFLKKNLI